MSTKAYDGMKIETSDIFLINKKIGLLSKKLLVYKEEAIANKIAELYTHIVDNEESYSLAKNTVLSCSSMDVNEYDGVWSSNDSHLWKFIMNLMEENQKHSHKTQLRCTEHDFSLMLTIYPISRERTLIYPCYEQSSYAELLKKYFDEYGYWNNTDPDENVSEEEWSQREKDWNTAFKIEGNYQWRDGDSTFHSFESWKLKNIVKKVVQTISEMDEKRAKHIAQKAINKKYFDSYLPEHNDKSQLSVSDYIHASMEVMDNHADETEELAKGIKGNLTKIDFDFINRCYMSKEKGLYLK